MVLSTAAWIAAARGVKAFLAESPADAARVETWRRQNETIRAAFASMETLPSAV